MEVNFEGKQRREGKLGLSTMKKSSLPLQRSQKAQLTGRGASLNLEFFKASNAMRSCVMVFSEECVLLLWS